MILLLVYENTSIPTSSVVWLKRTLPIMHLLRWDCRDHPYYHHRDSGLGNRTAVDPGVIRDACFESSTRVPFPYILRKQCVSAILCLMVPDVRGVHLEWVQVESCPAEVYCVRVLSAMGNAEFCVNISPQRQLWNEVPFYLSSSEVCPALRLEHK